MILLEEPEDRIRKYNSAEVRSIFAEENLRMDEMTYLTSISTFAIVTEIPGKDEPKLGGLRSTDIPVFEVEGYSTGILAEPGTSPIIFINEARTLMDYGLISELHPNHDWEIYLWLSSPWVEIESDFGIHGEWYRSDVYPDRMRPFDGKTLGWEDLPPVDKEKK